MKRGWDVGRGKRSIRRGDGEEVYILPRASDGVAACTCRHMPNEVTPNSVNCYNNEAESKAEDIAIQPIITGMRMTRLRCERGSLHKQSSSRGTDEDEQSSCAGMPRVREPRWKMFAVCAWRPPLALSRMGTMRTQSSPGPSSSVATIKA